MKAFISILFILMFFLTVHGQVEKEINCQNTVCHVVISNNLSGNQSANFQVILYEEKDSNDNGEVELVLDNTDLIENAFQKSEKPIITTFTFRSPNFFNNLLIDLPPPSLS